MENIEIKNLLKDANKIEIENIDTYLKERGVIIQVSFGGGRNAYKISPKAFGVKEETLSKESHEFLDEHFRNGSVTFIPNKKYKELRAIESRVKKKLREISIGYNNTFVPLKSFKEFAQYFDKAKKEYLEIGEELSEEYSNMLNRFKEIINKSIIDLNAYEAEKEYEKIMAEIPSADNFKNSFKADMIISLFPTMQNFDGVEDSLQKKLKEQYQEIGERLISESTVSLIDEGTTALISVLKSNRDNGEIHYKTIEKLKNSVKRLGEKNIFGNEKIEKIRFNIKNILKMDKDTILENCEKLLSELYVYSKELKIDEEIDLKGCPLTKKELEMIYELYE